MSKKPLGLRNASLWSNVRDPNIVMSDAIDALQHHHIPSVRQAMDAMFQRVCVCRGNNGLPSRTYGLVSDVDGTGVEETLADAEDQLTSLAQYLIETGLAGMPLSQEDDVQQVTRIVFEQRARLSDATSMVSSILAHKKKSA